MKSTITIACIVFASIAASAQSDIRKVNFHNFTYMPYCAGERPERVAVRAGEFSRERQMDGYVDRFYFEVEKPVYGDLDKDGKDEAIILSVCNTGGTGNFSEGFIYGLRAGKPALIARIPGGDRAYGGLRAVSVESGMLVVEKNDAGESGASCCPEFFVTSRYRLVGRRLVAVGKPVRAEIYPKQRVAFERGKSSASVTVTIEQNDRKRFVLGARAGQMLSVSSGNPMAKLQLLDDAVTTEGENSFKAKLPKTGDYTFEVYNTGDASISVTLDISIQ